VSNLSVAPIAAEAAGGSSSGQSGSSISNPARTVVVWVVLRRVCLVVGRSVRFWRDYYQLMHELDGLSDRDLRDLRVSRAEICSVAWSEAWRRWRESARRE